MLLIGAHMSIAGGIPLSLGRGQELGCRTIQIFTKNANQWRARDLTPEEVAEFNRQKEETKIWPVVAHDSYLINLGAPDEERLRKSREAFLIEMQRTELLGLPYLITHPGSHLESGEKEGLKKIAESIDWLHRRTEGFKMQILLETTSGQGTNLGYRFEHFSTIMDMVEDASRLGFCFDTCHVFTAGYDLRTRDAYEKTMEEFDRVIGLAKLKAFHINDAKNDLGSRIDRHQHIGKGEIGLDAFRLLLNDPRFTHLPKILETPKGKNMAEDKMNLAVLESLAEG
ncbi:deoxyribonuclease IV [bacterium (candidate division B38) B3_B38]|nr:MAG: deoxyribonuclease IV [bacterium (candidate division B38) B3_B38]